MTTLCPASTDSLVAALLPAFYSFMCALPPGWFVVAIAVITFLLSAGVWGGFLLLYIWRGKA